MHAIGLGSGLYVVYVVVLVPSVAFRSARVFNAPRETSNVLVAMPPLTRIYANTLLMLAVLFVFASLTARTFGYRVFALPRFGANELVAGVCALLFQFAMSYFNLVAWPADDSRGLTVERLLPRTSSEKALYAVTSIVAGVAEEAAYRGVLMSILWYALGNVWLAVFISALAFALGHALQGWKSMAVIFIMACSMHAVVWYTGTLVVAMAVHAVYDLLAPTFRRRILPAPPTSPERSAG